MLKIRFQRTGRKHLTIYSMVAMDSRVKRDGKFVEKVGYWNAHTKKGHVNFERVAFLVSRGAQISDSAKNIINRLQKNG